MPCVFAANYWPREDCCQVDGGLKQFGSFFMFFVGPKQISQTANPEASGPELLHRKANSGYFQRKSVNIGSNFLAGTNLPKQIPHKFNFGIHHLGPLREIFEKNPLNLKTHQLERWNPPRAFNVHNFWGQWCYWRSGESRWRSGHLGTGFCSRWLLLVVVNVINWLFQRLVDNFCSKTCSCIRQKGCFQGGFGTIHL